ncbi:preprotein translocase subunit SecG [Candidatus Microgenomates bacterium]|nr:preprotein translocase subunit SecG [Candidatus Microgenomates bacterium]
MQSFFNILAVVSGALMIVFILSQARGSSLGEAFGGDSTFYHKRRGVELFMYQLTVFLAVVFVLSIMLGILSR